MDKGNNLNTYKFSQRSGNDLYKFNNLKSENNNNNQGKQKQNMVNRNSNNIPSKQKILYNFSRKNSSVSNINLLSPINKYQQNFINFLDEHNLNSQTNYFLKKYYQLSKNQKKHSNKYKLIIEKNVLIRQGQLFFRFFANHFGRDILCASRSF